MASIGEQILERALAAITASGMAAGSVFRSREIGLPRSAAPAINIKPKDEPVTRQGQFTDQNALEVDFEIYTRGDPWDTLADPLYTQLQQVLTSDVQLLALCSEVRRLRRGFEGQEADFTAGILTVTYRFTFLTSATDVSVGPRP